MRSFSVGIQTPPEHVGFSQLRDVWQAADELGFRAAFTFDHFVPLNPGERPGSAAADSAPPRGPQLEGWTAATALAAATTRLEVGTLVSGVTYRHPALLAKMAVTLDHVTDGRAILGLGAAWHHDEHRRYGIDFPATGERMGRLDEALQIFHLLCESKDDVDFAGRWYRLEAAPFDPKPVRPGGIPILVGGSGPRLRDIACRQATMFNSFSAPWEWSALNTDLDERCAAAGRGPEELERTGFVFAELSGDPGREADLVSHFCRTRGGTETEARHRVVLADPSQAIDVLRSYRDAGVSMVVLNLRAPHSLDGLTRFAQEVLPALADHAPTDGPTGAGPSPEPQADLPGKVGG
jgi:alkanesulfonate monooxygenase SsuD/methylene tetrahydromethanopterin reductase-like flavin-dependent oxidoreductase (luciferase family)